MAIIAGILTVFIALNCLLLVLLVLIQLPKKDAGAGLAFGGGTADALFGAGSGNVLTKITKYATAIFFVLALSLGYVEERMHRGNSEGFRKALEQQQSQPQPGPAATPSAAPASTPAVPLTTPATGAAETPTAPAPVTAGTNAATK